MGVSNTRLLVAADTTVDLYPINEAAVKPGSDIRWYVGGTGANVATGVSLLYGSVELMANIGTDLFGTQVLSYLEQSPISTQYLTQVDATSPLALYVPDQAGGPRWDAWIDGSCFGFTLPDDVASTLNSFDWLYLSATTLPRTVNQKEIGQLLSLATEYDVSIAFNLNGRANQWPDRTEYRKQLHTVLPECDVVFASQEDLHLAGITSTQDELAPLLSEEGSVHIFVTRGADTTTGMVMADGQVQRKATADPPEVEVQSPAGAGDAFAAGILSTLFSGTSDLETLLAVGNAAGAAAVMSPGPLHPENIDDFNRIVGHSDGEKD